jgi:FKBP-type peptidyl-prolyl cis-trans isomerase SlpA
MSAAIQTGSRVMMHFTLRLAEEDFLVDSTHDDGEPFEFVAGDGELVPGLEQRLLGMCAGEKATFEIPAEEAYGPGTLTEDDIQNIARDEFPSDVELEPGMVIGFTLPSGEEVPGTIMGFTEDTVSVDFRHPLAGHDLVFEVEILDVLPPAS